MRKIENIIVHCSDSLWGCSREIRSWHLAKGWKDIGYHFVILNGLPTFRHSKNLHPFLALDGAIECGRYLDDDTFISDLEIGSHALGYNEKSIGVCLIGIKSFTPNQLLSLQKLCKGLILAYSLPTSAVIGHYETQSGKEQGKTCPNIDMALFRASLQT